MSARTCLLAALVTLPLVAADWPQWRGPNRDAKITGFDAPGAWPKELTKKWSVTVGDGVATPALVGDKLYVFAREDDKEVGRCLDAATGKEVWRDPDAYAAVAPRRPADGFPGPRASPAVADGKVVTLGVDGVLSCLDAATGKKVWRTTEFKGKVPGFATASSPLIVDGLCVVQLGGDKGIGEIIAFDLANGKEKWKWESDGTKFASPELLTAGGTTAVIAQTAGNVVALNLADGKFLWKTRFAERYNASTPVVDGQTIIYSGPNKGVTAVAVEKSGDGLDGKELWSSKPGVQFNTPVVKNGLVYGISDKDALFCLDAKTGKAAWTTPLKTYTRANGYGSVVDAGAVMFALNPSGEMIVFEPTDKEFKKLATYKVGTGTYAYPVIADKRVFIKDKNAVTLWLIE
jgi:outer membrane protein assembly factor BamB